MVDMLFKTFRAECKEIDDADGSLNLFIPVSTDSVDRDGEIVEPLAFKKTLPKFMKRPVLVASHDYRDLTSQIGEWKKLKITENGLEGRPRYYIGQGNEQADWGFKLASKGMAAFSIGFIPKVWADGDGIKEPRRTYKEVELLEISQVIVPSNREAIQSIRSKSVDPIITKICDEVEKDLELESEPEITKEIITKPEPDVTENYIRLRQRDPADFQEGSFRTIDISKSEGIKAVIGRLKGETSTTIQSYLFDKDKWTVERARAWVKEHAKKYLIAETTTTENEDINITVIKIPDTPQIYKEDKTSQEQIIDEIDYLKTLIEKEGLSEEGKESFEDLMRVSGYDKPVEDIESTDLVEIFTNQDILESLKRISNIGG